MRKAAERGFAALREQLKRTTQDTEAIRSALSGAQWLTQQQWSIRERRYSDLLLELARFQSSLEDRMTFFHEPGSEDVRQFAKQKAVEKAKAEREAKKAAKLVARRPGQTE
ncbi:hypothetical protein LNV23_20795 [Paucibacter sp. DJ1R-11]|uniref:hypothetical protein n=1 Tax=Paucibacter sp. DJ1R-11 TaxID=2893556 RepID=UPI0021E3BD0C|nr:hypothetical protein [Paucibacter sp. DJ1R-11]MCV2365894.1 hypothetical protein [Paucibacter sp. DJ1R-11]